MRIAIPHTLGKDEVRRRIETKVGRVGEKASETLGAMVTVETSWVDADHLQMDVSAMGFEVPTALAIEDSQIVFDVEVPAMLGFARKMIEQAITEKGTKLLA
ncbi:polyhydroxyalkanoic acid system family protein [Novosphingobium cyanobacteriorum]|uniref:Polyhydroxyalkanoic acid system family protein n=1 Tax=Novosphingobium cyanobacteriorum TaxID=3024215 RepID=A0ABT6CDV8_9SPHN|nr:polyhydroxyalkanoic acid system family protein [Novosphingobium cyanobacteriorum]MDF8332114.1 polyhydroxyalkanoic acid system family protein [Novosphingobium cyanobacteriorum]